MRNTKLPADYWQANGLTKHTLPKPAGLIECATVLDIGAGLRPFPWYRPKRHICVEPYEPYCERLEKAGHEVYRGTAMEALQTLSAEAIYMLDMIEHVEKEHAWEIIELALKKASVQVVIFTPVGFMPQDTDNWGCGGHSWQTHRSGWLPEEFPGWSASKFERGFTVVWTHGEAA